MTKKKKYIQQFFSQGHDLINNIMGINKNIVILAKNEDNVFEPIKTGVRTTDVANQSSEQIRLGEPRKDGYIPELRNAMRTRFWTNENPMLLQSIRDYQNNQAMGRRIA